MKNQLHYFQFYWLRKGVRWGCRRRHGSGREPSRSFLSPGNNGRLMKGKQGNASIREVERDGF